VNPASRSGRSAHAHALQRRRAASILTSNPPRNNRISMYFSFIDGGRLNSHPDSRHITGLRPVILCLFWPLFMAKSIAAA
jgi:hypothetical protein